EADGTPDDIISLVDLAKLAKKAYRNFETKGVITSVVDDVAIAAGESRLHPMPAQNQCTVTSSAPIKRIMVYDVLGNAVLNADDCGSERVLLSTAHLANGAYYVVIHHVGGMQYTQTMTILR
ncbi:MAG: T9SS type A sorting domain-containing protein, partial [Candidatus Kapabacteria bacterium]|nr:T9SS type A sorting domain-containing protein [Candidatus Kapabacteria bacterium]